MESNVKNAIDLPVKINQPTLMVTFLTDFFQESLEVSDRFSTNPAQDLIRNNPLKGTLSYRFSIYNLHKEVVPLY